MRAVVAMLVLAGVATAVAQDASAVREGIIRGTVRAADTGQPMANAAIRLTGGSYTSLSPRWAYTSADGTYELAGVPAGRYTVSASRVGYLRLDYGQQRAVEKGIEVVVSESSSTDRIDFALPPGSVIVARVVDEFGEPAAGYSVRAYRPNPGGGSLVAAGEADMFRSSDDRGEMRLWGLAPGEYYVAVTPGMVASVATPSRRAQGQTFYPGTTEAGAQPVTVGLGDEVFIEIPLTSVRPARISGVVVGQTRPLSPADVSLMRRVAGGTSGAPALTIRPDGSFSATGLGPAEYIISARGDNVAGRLSVRVSGEDIDGLVVTMRPTVRLRGRLTFDPKAPARSQWSSSIYPFSSEGLSPVSSSTINPDWSFELDGVSGAGVLRFPQLPAGWFIKAVVIDGKDVTDAPVDFASIGVRSIDVQLAQRMAQISGTAVDAQDRPTFGYSVVVFPEDRALWTLYSRFIAAARPDQSGRFMIAGLPAGRYLVRAIDYLQTGSERNPNTLERLRAGATAVTLGDRQSVDVRLSLAP